MFFRTKTILFAGALVIGLWSCQEPVQAFEPEESIRNRIIMIEAEGDVLHYQETLCWSEGKWAEILVNKSKCSSYQIEQFKKTYKVNAGNFSVDFEDEKNSSLLRCDVHGKFTGNWYDFHWFLNPMDLDFLDSPFDKTERVLSWKGPINEISTSIVLEFPFHIQNCHAHVWPK